MKTNKNKESWVTPEELTRELQPSEESQKQYVLPSVALTHPFILGSSS